MVQIQMDYSDEPVRDILCIDVKSFFASVEAVDLGIHPLEAYVAVVSRPQASGGLVLAASPRVKKEYGIKTGSRVFDIPKHSKIQIVPPRMGHYLEKNRQIIDIFKRYVASEDLHIYSIDESFIDVTHSHKLFGSNWDIARKIQEDVWEELGLILTVGIGDNPLLAKLALDNEAKDKREASYTAYWSYNNVRETIWKIPRLKDMWGIGSKTAQHLENLGIRTVYDLSQYDVRVLKDLFGVMGEQLFFHAHGIDRSIIREKYQPLSNSYSKHQILDRDYTQKNQILIVIHEMVDQVAARLRSHHAQAGKVHLSVGYSKDILEKGFSRQMKIYPSNRTKDLIEAVDVLFDRHYTGQAVRSIGVSCGQISFQTNIQLDLFEDHEETRNQIKLEQTIDSVRKKYGYSSLVQAASLTEGATAIDRSDLIGGHQA